MFAVFKRELLTFFNSLVAYITIGIFLLCSGLLLWFFPDTSVLDYGYAELSGFFAFSPFLFMFFIPAVTMRSFAEERKEGTFILLATKPISNLQIVMAKYLACLVLVFLSLLPTVIYAYTIYQLAIPVGNIDTGAIIGSYLGLVFLGASFTALGILSSSLTKNQIVAFAIAVFFSFLFFAGFDAVSKIDTFQTSAVFLANLGIGAHYESISRGVLDSRDVVYFAGLILLFLGSAKLVLEGRKW